MTGWPPADPPEPREIIPTPDRFSRGTVARVIPLERREGRRRGEDEGGERIHSEQRKDAFVLTYLTLHTQGGCS